MLNINKSKEDFLKDIEELNFYCLKKENCFRLNSKKQNTEVLKIPIEKSYYGPRYYPGGSPSFGSWQDKYYSAKVYLNNGVLEITNCHSEPTKYKINTK